MQFVTISDVHIKEPGDNQEKLFLEFLKSKETQGSDSIFLLGDIFDLVVGGHVDYYEKYKDVFEALVSQCVKGKKIYQFEGNHDFHFEKLLKFIKEKHELKDESWVYFTKPLTLEIDGRRTLFAHGDEIEIENLSYDIYKGFIRSYPINFLANWVVPFSFVDGIGRYFSKKSRKRNNKRYSKDLSDFIQDKFRRTFKKVQKEYQVVDLVCGHSHSRDFYESEGLYLNNGYFPATKTFNFYNGKYSQIKIDQQAAE